VIVSLVVQAKNYRGLVEVEWEIPSGVSVIVGANGAGKTTLLFLVDLLRHMIARDGGILPALEFYGGARALKHLAAAADDPVVLGARWNDIAWQIEPVPVAGGIAPFSAERLQVGSDVLFDRITGSPTVTWQGAKVGTDARSVFRRIAESDLVGNFPGRPLLDALEGCHIYFDYDFRQLRQGSEDSPHPRLHWNGLNAFSLLRTWRDWTPDRKRYDFVVESLRECFGFFEGLDFKQGGKFTEGWVVERLSRGMFPAGHAATGWLVALLHFTAVAGADPGQIVGLDDFENALHPGALRRALDLIDAQAEANRISVILTTQSPLVLDWFESRPENVFVLDRRRCPGPRPLTELKSDEWLAHFRLGRKFADGDFGAEPSE
jgi:predicted ATPase